MNTELLKDKLFQQSVVYNAVKNGDCSQVQYVEQYDSQWGKCDKNYTNRMRLAYYLLYAHIDDENIVGYLFQEELKDRKSNSFQGIGDTLVILTSLLNKYNVLRKYDKLLDEAKNANFDCACGYDKNSQMDDEISSLDLIDCIHISQCLDYKDVMEILVNNWKDSIVNWTDANRNTLIKFNSFLGKEIENKKIYEILLENAIVSEDTFKIVSAYNTLIKYYINDKQVEKAYAYMKKMIDSTDFKEIEKIRLFGDVLEECFDIICAEVAKSFDLWEWAKPYAFKNTIMYGNLYKKGIAAAKCINDPCSIELEREYSQWKMDMGIR